MRTRKIKAAEASRITVAGRPAPLSPAAVAQAARAVLVKEGQAVDLSFAFVGVARIRELNRRWRGADRPTDILAFPLEQPGGGLAGDVYICRTVAEREAAARKLPLREELLRLVVHGTLHVLGYDHPEGTGRTRSSMWRRQERYLACLR